MEPGFSDGGPVTVRASVPVLMSGSFYVWAPLFCKGKSEKSCAFRAGRDFAPVLLFNAEVPTPTAPEYGYPGSRWSPSVTWNSQTQEHSIALFSSCSNWEGLPSLGPKIHLLIAPAPCSWMDCVALRVCQRHQLGFQLSTSLILPTPHKDISLKSTPFSILLRV